MTRQNLRDQSVQRKPRARVEKWLEIDTTQFLCESYSMSVGEIGETFFEIISAAQTGSNICGENAVSLSRFLSVRQRTIRRGSLPQSLRTLIMDRDGEVCFYCRSKTGPWEVDHIHPVSKGGDDSPDNLCVACKPCNRAKGAKSVEEWIR